MADVTQVLQKAALFVAGALLLDYLLLLKVQWVYSMYAPSQKLRDARLGWVDRPARRHIVVVVAACLATYRSSWPLTGLSDPASITVLLLIALWWVLLAFDAMKELKRGIVTLTQGEV
jgi:amino acid transporter